jgi:hypothetical protein
MNLLSQLAIIIGIATAMFIYWSGFPPYPIENRESSPPLVLNFLKLFMYFILFKKNQIMVLKLQNKTRWAT